MEFDEADIQGMIDDGTFVDTVTHEMAHVLGFGTVWSALGLISGEGGDTPTFTGRLATAAYNKLFGGDESGVPVESGGGDGTADSHWPEDSFVEEMMTGYAADPGLVVPISTVTVAQFADLGYTVNMNAADVWNPYRHRTTLTTALDLGGVAYERRVTVASERNAENVGFGLRENTAPSVGRFSATPATLGENTRLNASRVTDAEGDTVTAVTFYGESNGIAGLQRGAGGDLYLGVDTTNTSGTFTVTASTAGLAAGTQTFYAIATDAIGYSRRSTTTAELTAPPAPTRPNPVVATRQSTTSTLLQWKDRSNNEIGFRIEIATDVDYTDTVKAFNVAADSVSSLITGLTRGTTYFVRIRSYGYGGASAYTRLSGVRV
ncbi:MAG: leishmanolysin-related zinc metalloendopeptidase [Tepidisphaeraceae bacterium]